MLINYFSTIYPLLLANSFNFSAHLLTIESMYSHWQHISHVIVAGVRVRASCLFFKIYFFKLTVLLHNTFYWTIAEMFYSQNVVCGSRDRVWFIMGKVKATPYSIFIVLGSWCQWNVLVKVCCGHLEEKKRSLCQSQGSEIRELSHRGGRERMRCGVKKI